jgi:glycosyltransferase involved in cell wall biosynthesis
MKKKDFQNYLEKIKKFLFNNKLNIEFIFVNDGSTDSSLKLLKNFKKKNQKKIKF